jgi:hypothetical protein
MPWAGQTWIEVVQEGTAGANYGVFNATPGAGQTLYPTIYGPNAFTVRKVPQRKVIRTADAGNRRRLVVANRTVYQGTFHTLLHPDQASFWLTAAASLASDAGGHPWLPSYSFLYWDSVQAWKLLGGMLQTLTITSTAEQDYVTMSQSWIFQTRDTTFTTFAQPAESNYSTVVPYQHIETASNCKLGGTAFTKYKSVTVNLNNVLAGTWDELPYISALYYCGRDLDFHFGPQYLATTYRGDFEAQTPLTFVLEWLRASPAHSLLLTLETASYISSVQDDLPLDGPGYQDVEVQCFYDPANTADFTFAAS